ncbi:MucR family transcriptional regulator [Lactococcus lactis]
MDKTDIELTAEIVEAYLSNPSIIIKAQNIPELIKNVHATLIDLE